MSKGFELENRTFIYDSRDSEVGFDDRKIPAYAPLRKSRQKIYEELAPSRAKHW